ncbi:MAG: NAD(P)H-binding protein [Rhodothermales bacterium]
MNCLLFGATGLVGRECLTLLLEDEAYETVHVLTRRAIDDLAGHPKAVQHVVDFDAFIESGEAPEVDHVFSALGTTMAKAGSKDAFRKVDYGYTLAIAKMARETGARHFVLVSSMGASTKSLFFYSRVKGAVEEEAAKLGYPALTIIRPSVIVGDRPERRLGEKIGAWLLRFGPRALQPVHARDIAAAMVNAARTDPIGKRVILSKAIPRSEFSQRRR